MKRLLAFILIVSALLSMSVFAEDNIYNKIRIVNIDLPSHDSSSGYKEIDTAEELEEAIDYVKTNLVTDKSENTIQFMVKLNGDARTSEKVKSLSEERGDNKTLEEVHAWRERLFKAYEEYYGQLFENNRHLFDVFPGATISNKKLSPDVIVTVDAESLTANSLVTLAKSDNVAMILLYEPGKVISYIIYPEIDKNFTDVPENAWFSEYVSKAYVYGIMEGTTATTFEPDAALTRAMLVTMIGRFDERLNGTLGEAAENPFSDVKPGKWYSDYVARAAEIGIVEGYPDGTFRPDKEVTREEAVTILGRYYKLNAPETVYTSTILVTYFPHTDTAEIADWAQKWVYEGMRIGAIHYEKANYGDTMADAPEYYFEPGRSMTRAEAAKVAYIFLNDLRLSIENGYCARSCDLDAVK